MTAGLHAYSSLNKYYFDTQYEANDFFLRASQPNGTDSLCTWPPQEVVVVSAKGGKVEAKWLVMVSDHSQDWEP